METYITEITVKNETQYGFFAGPEIRASSWQNAQEQAKRFNVTLIGLKG